MIKGIDTSDGSSSMRHGEASGSWGAGDACGSRGFAGRLNMRWPNKPDSGLVVSRRTTLMSPLRPKSEVATNIMLSRGT